MERLAHSDVRIMTTLPVLSMVAFVATLSGCIASSGDIANASSNADPPTPDAGLATDAVDASPAPVDAGANPVTCDLILDPRWRAACATCLANPPVSDGSRQTCELVDVGSNLGPTTCCIFHLSDESGNQSCEAIFTYDRMAFVGACPPVQ
jgi:hypothetical protein